MVTLTRESNMKAGAVTTIFLAAMLLAVGNARAGWSDTEGLSRSDSQGPVMVTATYMPPDKTTGEIRFIVKLNTHSVDLDRYPMGSFAFLRFDDGKEYKSLGAMRQGSGHHVVETLRFAGPVPKGAREITLILRDL
ncbi:MAG: hypothetical protein IH611_04565, partial [Deltaproteobacteria bacterium]|nr:hypothetical protein [Deltaproteobacteria bacterium]